MEFVVGNQSAEPLQLGKQPFHSPAPFVAVRISAVLRLAVVLPVGRDHLDAVFLVEMPIQRVGVICLVADQPYCQSVEEAASKCFVDELGLMRRGRIDRDSQRNAVSGGEGFARHS